MNFAQKVDILIRCMIAERLTQAPIGDPDQDSFGQIGTKEPMSIVIIWRNRSNISRDPALQEKQRRVLWAVNSGAINQLPTLQRLVLEGRYGLEGIVLSSEVFKIKYDVRGSRQSIHDAEQSGLEKITKLERGESLVKRPLGRRREIDLKRMRMLFEQGHTRREVAAIMGCSVHPIDDRRREHSELMIELRTGRPKQQA